MKFTIAILFCALISMATPGTASDDGITLINAFEVPADKLDETIAFWEQARDYLQTQPGYISTALHQSITDDARFRLVNIAIWESADAFFAASKNMRAEAELPKIEGLTANPALYTVIRRD